LKANKLVQIVTRGSSQANKNCCNGVTGDSMLMLAWSARYFEGLHFFLNPYSIQHAREMKPTLQTARSSMIIFLLLVLPLGAFKGEDLEGVWVRKSDHLRIEIRRDKSSADLLSLVVAEGDEKFPCDVSELPIYKNIKKVGRGLWTCDFLVVTMGSCATGYEEGVMRMMHGELEITCPGFEKKYYTKLKARYGD
jgi:hypothetical protein